MRDPGVARHELGHVAALEYYRRPWFWVALDEVSGCGWTCFEPDRIPPFERSVVAMAGPIAQARYLRREIPVAPDDRRIAEDALASLPDDSRSNGAAAVRQATAIVEARWPMIERGARALLARGRLTRGEAERLLSAPPEREWRSPRWT
jgi:hypothetical protein